MAFCRSLHGSLSRSIATQQTVAFMLARAIVSEIRMAAARHQEILGPTGRPGPRLRDGCVGAICANRTLRRKARCFDTPDPKGLPMPGRGQMRVIPFIRSPHRCVRLSEQSCSLVELTQVFGRSLLINLVCQYHQNLSAPMFRKRTGPRPRWMILSRLN